MESFRLDPGEANLFGSFVSLDKEIFSFSESPVAWN